MKPHPDEILATFDYDGDAGTIQLQPLPNGRARPGRQVRGFLHRGHMSIRTGTTTLRIADIAHACLIGTWPDNIPVYKDGNPLNLKWDNFDFEANAKPPVDLNAEVPKYKGVMRVGPYSFRAQVRVRENGKSVIKYLGTHPTPEAARDAVTLAEAMALEPKRNYRTSPDPALAMS